LKVKIFFRIRLVSTKMTKRGGCMVFFVCFGVDAAWQKAWKIHEKE